MKGKHRRSRWHVHRFRPVGEVYGPFVGNRYGTWGNQIMECRCGDRYEDREVPYRQPRRVPLRRVS